MSLECDLDEAYRHMRVQGLEQTDEAAFPTQMEPAFSLAFLRKCKDGAVILNPDGRVGFMNDAAQAALGLESIGDAVLMHWSELWPAEVGEKMSEAITRTLRGEAVRLAGLPAANGLFDMLTSPVINADGRVESIFAVLFPSGTNPRISG